MVYLLSDKAAFSKRLNKVDMLNSRDLGRYINQVLLPFNKSVLCCLIKVKQSSYILCIFFKNTHHFLKLFYSTVCV